MERLRRLRSLWNFLPGFRVVAETEHLPTASQLLFVSPSALSRTIQLLEGDLGRPLFDRVGRGIVLNPAGHKLLSGVRDAMRLIDDVLDAIAEKQMIGPLHVGANAPVAAVFALPLVLDLRADHPNLFLSFREIEERDVAQLLLRGDIDLALCFEADAHEDLELFEITSLSTSVYCGRKHPLARQARTSSEAIRSHPFIAPERGDDGWPPELRRTTILSGPLSLRIEACRDGVLAVLPDAIARRHHLVRLRSPRTSPIPLYAIRRRALLHGDKVAALLDRMLDRAKALE